MHCVYRGINRLTHTRDVGLMLGYKAQLTPRIIYSSLPLPPLHRAVPAALALAPS